MEALTENQVKVLCQKNDAFPLFCAVYFGIAPDGTIDWEWYIERIMN